MRFDKTPCKYCGKNPSYIWITVTNQYKEMGLELRVTCHCPGINFTIIEQMQKWGIINKNVYTAWGMKKINMLRGFIQYFKKHGFYENWDKFRYVNTEVHKSFGRGVSYANGEITKGQNRGAVR